MTTPQSQLGMLSDRIWHLVELFEASEDEESIFETVRQLESHMQVIMANQERVESMLILIVRLLDKHEKI